MDEDNTPATGPSLQPGLQPSSSDMTQGALEPHSQGNPTPTSVQSSNTSSGTPSNASGSALANSQHSKRGRRLGVVTPNACTECRKKRTKCDGQNPCGRCKGQKDIDCLYEVPVRQSKENLRAEIENLRHRQRYNDQVFAALVRPEHCEEVLTRLRGDQSVESVSEWLVGVNPSQPQSQPQPPAVPTKVGRNSRWHFSSQSQAGSTRSNSHPVAMSWTADVRGPPQSQVGSWADGIHPDHLSDGLPRFRGLEQVLSPLNDPEMRNQSTSWTSITGDINLVQHLLALYFCWEYPTFASLSKEHFLQDFQDGRHRYCSPILINALLALGCCFSTQPMTLANPNDPYSCGDNFFKESQQLFNQETDHHNLTTVQALGIMSIWEASCGRDSESWYCAGQSIRLAIEMGLHRLQGEGDEDKLAVQAATFWGAFALDHAWSLATGSLPQCSYFPRLPPKPAIIGDVEASLWVPYTDDGAPVQRSCEQPSNVHSYDRIPEVLRLGYNFTPTVLFTHMYYHFAILLLFRPLIKLRIIGSKVSPRDVCSQTADAIQGLLKSYSQLYTLRRTPSFVPHFVLTSAIMHLAIGATKIQSVSDISMPNQVEAAVKIDSHVKDAIRQGIDDLTEMAPCHRFAEKTLNILRHLAQKWDIEVGIHSSTLTSEEYDRLVTAGGDETPGGLKTADAMENPLFWPFRMQGRPILPRGNELEDAGFAIF
ncbi:fungal-specific transcription factor domain-containing protein [Dactylonectria estremocensis]|uniref:Fungal-specific transcription factor domain-containing protein n=1 Tax=Dactylonectria estremocensis TaxID=1079267 RepID=A0A9P9EW56_9HYPO|nr:fungal-specific transcription factor domain-containing protein [Dactylonectria estremocensis]